MLDCWGLVRKIYNDELGITLPTLDGYKDSEDGGQAQEIIEAESFANWEKHDNPDFPDVVVFRMGRHASHVGIMIDSVRFLHSIKGRMSCIERVDKAQWEKRVDGYYKWSPACQ